MRQHRGAERRRIDGVGLRPLPGRVGEEFDVGGLEAVPHLLDVVGRVRPKRRDGGLGEPGRDADAQGSGDQLQQRPAADLVERIEPAGDDAGQRHLAGRRQDGDDLRECGLPHLARSRRPDQRHRLRQVADVVIGHPEQLGIGPLGHERMEHRGLGVGEHERIGQRRQRIAAFGVGRRLEIGLDQADLAVAAGLESETIEQFGESLHAASATSSSTSSP